MTAKKQNAKKAFHFKKWSRKGYAVFQSLGKVVHIGVILMTYNLLTQPVIAQEMQEVTDSQDADTLPEVEIVTSEPGVFMGLSGVPQQSIRVIENAVQDASELAEDFPGTDIRQRGIHGVQGDISIRGGNPEQAGIFLNGIPLNDVQTGHHNLNLPIPAISITQIQRFTPGTSQQPGSGIYSGGLNFQNLHNQKQQVRIWLAGGQYQYADISTAVDFKTGKAKHHAAIARKSSTGYAENTDFKMLKSYWHTAIPIKEKFNIALQAGYVDKEFGAQSFYSDKYPHQFEAVNSSFGSLKLEKTGKIKLSSGMYFREHNDRFELFRESLYQQSGEYFVHNKDSAKFVPGIFAPWNYYSRHNYHKTQVFGYFSDMKTSNFLGNFHLGINHRHEKILSNVLGKERLIQADETQNTSQFTKQAIRDQFNLLASFQSVELSKCFVGLSGLLHYTESYGLQSYGGARLHYKHSDNFSSWAAINQSMRLPSFTDLYYSGPTNLGNPELLPEDAINFEIGSYLRKGILSTQIQVFHLIGRNTIDWVKQAGDEKYTSMNHTRLNTTGAEISMQINTGRLAFFQSWLQTVNLNYTRLVKTKASEELISAYALDYLRHQALLQVNHTFSDTGLGLNWALRYQDRAGSYTSREQEVDYGHYILTDISVNYTWKSQSIFVECANIFDVKVNEIGNIPLPGRWFKLGLRIDFQLT
ncbi:MAG: TonB-dependent receptor [Bacteroidales bacterium]|jgi:vitamin B12 transporter|nr:TonB-dependent receptor [Bacteroidales bacterium]